MLKKAIKIILLTGFPFLLQAQNDGQKELDSLHLALGNAGNDTSRMETSRQLAGNYAESNRDSANIYADRSLNLARELRLPFSIAAALELKSYLLLKSANYSLSFKLCNEALEILQDKSIEKGAYIAKEEEFASQPAKYRQYVIASIYHQLGNTYDGAGNNDKAIEYFKKEIALSQELQTLNGQVTSNMNIGSIYANMNKQDSAIIYSRRGLENARLTGWKSYEGYILDDIGQILLKKGALDSAHYYFTQAVIVNRDQNNLAGLSGANNSLSSLFQKKNQPDSMLYYASRALQVAYQLKSARAITISSEQVAAAWKLKGKADSALVYLTIAKTLGDSLSRDYTKKVTQFQVINFDEQIRLEKEAQNSIAEKNRIRTIALSCGLALLLILFLTLFRFNRQKQKDNQILKNALTDLKSTQTQLIQSEKMASLGELTAGIAHEIQNPLNFVNNFSEVNRELVSEMKEELDKGNYDAAKQIAEDLVKNEEKIIHHGKRADTIVKGMLQHSRTGGGQKEPTDINALCDEYLRLAYHGLRAKDKSFNANIKTDFHPGLQNISVNPQDIGRVILNLINNAFYSVSERKKLVEDGYEPTVTVTTSRKNGKVEISIRDNGNGIPAKILSKIFQPFFTTKPTGQGTGLGLSLSYDIVKAHGGEINVNTKENEGTEFTIILPA